MNNVKTYQVDFGGKPLIIESGRLAWQAGGAVTVRLGDSVLLCTATASAEVREGIDFFPLSVEFEERLYAAGRIPGSFFRREGRPSESAILTARLIDRPLRPLFPKGYRNDVQVIATALSSDSQNFLDIPAIIGASAALMISDIPFLGPIGACRVGLVDDEFVINPTADQLAGSPLDLRMAGTEDAILMVEAGAAAVHESVMLEALRVGHQAMQSVIALQKQMAAEIGKPKVEVEAIGVDEGVRAQVEARIGDRLAALLARPHSKTEWGDETHALRDEIVASFAEDETVDPADVKSVFEDMLKAAMRSQVLDRGVRADGRETNQIRPISSEVGILPRAHGSGLFSRGETQVLSIATLGTPREEQKLDTLRPEDVKRYMHHYNFPPFSTGEAYPLRGPRRREIGHGALAETALRYMLPNEDEFPYTVRVVSEVLSSNGSTSMASVCGSTLSLMDAGVPIKSPVAGIAMGLILEGERYAILSDIQGMEDHLGDMDFKVAGTREGITALQMDMKVTGLAFPILEQALSQARTGRLFILDKIAETISEPRPEMSPYAPRITTMHVDPDKIGKIIGPGGKMIRKIQEECQVEIDIEDDGTVYISATEGPAAQRAIELIEGLTEEPEIGKVYVGKVVRIESYGAFVEIMPGVDGMVHISQLADYRVPSVEDVVQLGDEIMVMIIDIDPDTGKIRLSRQAVLEGWTAEEARERDRKTAPSGGGSRGGGGGGGGPRGGGGGGGPRGGGGGGGGGGDRRPRGPRVNDQTSSERRPPQRRR